MIRNLASDRCYAEDGCLHARFSRPLNIHFRQAQVDRAIRKPHLPGATLRSPVGAPVPCLGVIVIRDVAQVEKKRRLEADGRK